MIKRTMDELGRMSVEEYRAADKLPMVVVLDNVRSQHNVGAVFRTADAMRIAGVVLCGICCCPPNQEIHKTALGAENSVEWSYFRNTADAVMQLREQGFRVFAVEQAHDSVTLEAFCEQFTNHQSPGASSRQTGGAASAEKGFNYQSPITNAKNIRFLAEAPLFDISSTAIRRSQGRQ